MRTVKKVAELSGVSIRTLQYYDEIGIFKPTLVSDSGYRMYDDEALKTLQQILFFKELDFPLKDIKDIMENPRYDKIEAFRKQKELLYAKRNRLDALISLLERLEKGESCMSFKEFELSDYLQALEQFKSENTEEVIKNWGSEEAFEQFIQKIKDNDAEVAKMAIQQYGSVEKYTEAMKENLKHFPEIMERINHLDKDAYMEKNRQLNDRLVSDLTKDVTSEEIQDIVHEIVKLSEEVTQGMSMGQNYWDMAADGYLHNAQIIEYNDKKYGTGASEFIGKAFQYYFKKEKAEG